MIITFSSFMTSGKCVKANHKSFLKPFGGHPASSRRRSKKKSDSTIYKAYVRDIPRKYGRPHITVPPFYDQISWWKSPPLKDKPTPHSAHHKTRRSTQWDQVCDPAMPWWTIAASTFWWRERSKERAFGVSMYSLEIYVLERGASWSYSVSQPSTLW